jgi:hypothetical protein
MKKIIILLVILTFAPNLVFGSTKNESRMRTAEKALAEKKYADAKAVFEDLKDNPTFREKCYLYLAMIYNETGQIENAQAALADLKRYVTDKTDITILKSSEGIDEEINKHYANLDIAIFDERERPGVDQGFYNLVFRSDGGLSASQEARLKLINKTLSQAQSLFSWKSDGTFLKGTVMYFPIRMFDTEPMTAEINGNPVYFRFDFQTKQGLWIPAELLSHGETIPAAVYRETSEPVMNRMSNDKKPAKYYMMFGFMAAVMAAGMAIAASQ